VWVSVEAELNECSLDDVQVTKIDMSNCWLIEMVTEEWYLSMYQNEGLHCHAR